MLERGYDATFWGVRKIRMLICDLENRLAKIVLPNKINGPAISETKKLSYLTASIPLGAEN